MRCLKREQEMLKQERDIFKKKTPAFFRAKYHGIPVHFAVSARIVDPVDVPGAEGLGKRVQCLAQAPALPAQPNNRTRGAFRAPGSEPCSHARQGRPEHRVPPSFLGRAQYPPGLLALSRAASRKPALAGTRKFQQPRPGGLFLEQVIASALPVPLHTACHHQDQHRPQVVERFGLRKSVTFLH